MLAQALNWDGLVMLSQLKAKTDGEKAIEAVVVRTPEVSMRRGSMR
jgi:hypothetical protein